MASSGLVKGKRALSTVWPFRGTEVVDERTEGREGTRGSGNEWLAAPNFLGALVQGLLPPLWGSICCLPMLGWREGNLRGPPHLLLLL